MPNRYSVTVKEPRKPSRRFTVVSTWDTKKLKSEALELTPRGTRVSVKKLGKAKRMRLLRE